MSPFAYAVTVIWILLSAMPGTFGAANAPRQLLVTIDDLPISDERPAKTSTEERRTNDALLQVLADQGIRAIGFVHCGSARVEDDATAGLLRRWIEEGHELGQLGGSRNDFDHTDPRRFFDEAESCRKGLNDALRRVGGRVRLFRFPQLREGIDGERAAAGRRYLERSGQRLLRATVSLHVPELPGAWEIARRADDDPERRQQVERFRQRILLALERQEALAQRLFPEHRPPQVLRLRATALGVEAWPPLFEALRARGYEFVDADTILADPAWGEAETPPTGHGLGHWYRLALQDRIESAEAGILDVIRSQTEAWNRGDLEGFCHSYADDTWFVSPNGVTQGGPEQIHERYRKRYPNRKAMGHLTLEALAFDPAYGFEPSVEGPVPGEVHAASLVARWTLDYPKGSGRPQASGHTLLVFRRRGASWVIARDASM